MHLGILLFDECADWEVSQLLTQLRECGVKATLMSAAGAPVRAASGLVLATERVRPVELLVLPGGEPWLTPSPLDDVVAPHEGPLAAICAATIGVGRTGRLNHRRHTGGYPAGLRALAEYYGAPLYQEAPCVRDGDLLTAQGLGMLEFARELLIWTGALPAVQAEAWFDVYRHAVVRPLPGPSRTPSASLHLAPLEPAHWPEVARIYDEGLADRAGLETIVPSWEEWDRTHLPHSRLVALQGHQVAGWIAAMAVEGGCCYRGVAELSVYVGSQFRGGGVGVLLLEGLVASLREHGYWTVQAQIIRENVASLALHRQAGFRIVGTRERIGQREGRWHDVILLELRLAVGPPLPSPHGGDTAS